MSSTRSSKRNSNWTRREWLATSAAHTGAFSVFAPMLHQIPWRDDSRSRGHRSADAPFAGIADPAQLRDIVRRAVEAARAAGARYADARLTRVVYHNYRINGGEYRTVVNTRGDGLAEHAVLQLDTERVGLGVRALVNSAWGFAASPLWIGHPGSADAIASIAKDAVRQAKATAGGSPHPVDLVPVPIVTGDWSTPIAIDPFAVPIEEKIAAVGHWKAQATNAGIQMTVMGGNHMSFAREERALATSEGTLITQVLYDTGGSIMTEPLNSRLKRRGVSFELPVAMSVENIFHCGKGWELFENANMQQQFEHMRDELPRRLEMHDKARPENIGRYTLVCDGETMASLLEHTLGTATQLDRALAYEANASGTSFITDPLAMAGQLRLAPDTVTVTANRNAPSQLATVRWDDEGVQSTAFTLVEQGMLADFQTTREQAQWLAPYYERIGRPVHSNGCAAAEDALFITAQHMPNLSLEPGRNGGSVSDLIATVKDGIFFERGKVAQMDSQGRSGLIAAGWGDRTARTRKITNGHLAGEVSGLALMFDTVDLWKHVTAVGGEATRATISNTGHDSTWSLFGFGGRGLSKGLPPQISGHTVQSAAAIIVNQPLIDPTRKA